jgi:D-alanine-D-alanine ligase
MSSPLPPVLVIYNIPRVRERMPDGIGLCAESEAGVLKELSAVMAAMERLGVPARSSGIHRLEDLPVVLAAACEPVVFNLVEDLEGPPGDAAMVPALCRAFSKACTGGNSRCLGLSGDKWLSKAALTALGVPCPQAVMIPPGVAIDNSLPPGPLIVKPVSRDASEGIDAGSMCESSGEEFLRAVRRVHEQFRQPALVEQYIDGREINVALLQQGEQLRVLPLAEIDFSAFPPHRPRIVDYQAKWVEDSFEYRNTPRVIPARIQEPQAQRIRQAAQKAWQAVGCTDYARVDCRLDQQGNVFVLEVNANPDVSPDAGFAAALEAGGIGYDEFIRTVVSNAAGRLESVFAASRGDATGPRTNSRDPRPVEWKIRWSQPGDREEIMRFLDASGFFRPDELATAQEVLEEALAKGPSGHYQSFTTELDRRAVGWVCYGPTPCTVGTFDIYWLGVAPDLQGRGLGKALVSHAEKLIAESGGRLAVVETSGRKTYDPTRGFYSRMGYRQAACIPNFYAPQDDKVVYVKPIGRT